MCYVWLCDSLWLLVWVCVCMSECVCFCVIYQLVTAGWLMLEVWLAGLQINRSASETSQRQRELALAPAAAACWNIFTFHLGSWWWNRKVFNLDINSVRTGTACFGFFYTDKQTDRDRWIHAYMIDAILCNICHFSTDPWLQFVNNTQVECHIFFQHSHKCPIYRIRTRQTERWLLNYSVTERQLPW